MGRGISPESDIAVFNMLGYSFDKGYPGRGVVESIGGGHRDEGRLPCPQGELRDEVGRKITDRRAGRDITADDAMMLQDELKKVKLNGCRVRFQEHDRSQGGAGHKGGRAPLRGGLEHGPRLRPGERVRGREGSQGRGGHPDLQAARSGTASRRAADLVNAFSTQAMKILDEAKINHERRSEGKKAANMLLFRDAGSSIPKLPSFEEKHHYKGVALVEMPAEVGIAILLDMKMVKVDDPGDLSGKAHAPQEGAEGGDRRLRAHQGSRRVRPRRRRAREEGQHRDDRQGVLRHDQRSARGRGDPGCLLRPLDPLHPQDAFGRSGPIARHGERKTSDSRSCRFTEKDAKRGSMGLLSGRAVLKKVLSIDT